MKWFRRIIIGFVSIYIICLGLDVFISKSLLNSNLFSSELSVWKDIYDKNIDDDLVIYGSSRSYVHINPKILDRNLELNSYNLGFNGQKIELQKYRNDIVLEKGNLPKNVIINLDIGSLTIQDRPYLNEQFIPLLLYNNTLFKIVGSSLNFNKIDIYIPLIRYRIFNFEELVKEVYKIYVYSNYKQSRIKGFEGINRKWISEDLKQKEILISEDRKHDLFEMIEDLQKVNTNVILINSPEYISQIESQINRDEIIKLYDSIARIYNIPFIDYSKDSINYKKELFYNPNHLNAKGADIFTKKLAEDIRPYIKR